MFSSKKLFAALLALVLSCSPAAAQLATTHAGTVGGAKSTPVSNACINSSGTTITFTAQGTGGANVNRLSVVTIAWSDSTAAGTAELSGVTLGGVAMNRAVRAAGDDQNSNSEIWYIANPTGTTANIVATFSTAVDGVTIEVYSLIGYNSFIPVASTTGTTSVSQAYTNKQVALAVGSRTTNVSTSLSNMTNDFSSACGASLWGVHASQKLSGNGTLSSTITPSTSNPKIALAVWAQAAPATCSEATAFLARTSGLTQFYTVAYTNLVCGIVSDGNWTKFDAFYIFATKDATTANLNLVSSSFTIIPAIGGSAPTFTANRGYNGTLGTGPLLDTQFNPSTASSPKFVLNSAHLGVWVANNAGTGTNTIAIGGFAAVETNIFPRHSDGNAYFRVNGGAIGGVTNATATGYYIATRPSSSTVNGFKNGSSVLNNTSATSSAVLNLSTPIGSGNLGTSVYVGQIAAGSIGSDITSQANAVYTRLRTYMTTVGVP